MSVFKKITVKLEGTKKRHLQGIEKGMLQAAVVLLGESQKLVPVQTGQLKASGTIKASKEGVQVVYSDPKAIYVHERLDLAHGKVFNVKHAEKIANAPPNHPIWFKRGENEQAKFLTRASRRNRDKMRAVVMKAIVKG